MESVRNSSALRSRKVIEHIVGKGNLLLFREVVHIRMRRCFALSYTRSETLLDLQNRGEMLLSLLKLLIIAFKVSIISSLDNGNMTIRIFDDTVYS